MKTKSLILILSLLSSTSLFSQIPSYVPTNGLVGYWPFNGNANDESGNGNNAVLQGNASFATDRYSVANSSYLGDLTSGADITALNNFPFGNSERTISLWFQNSIPYPGGNRQLFSYGDNNSGGRFGLYLDGAFIGVEHVNGARRCTYTPDGNWHNITVTYPSSGMGTNDILLYFDGLLQSSSNINPVSSLNTANSYIHWIGTLGFSPGWLYAFSGKIDDIGIWNRALTQQEITALYQSNNCSVPAYVPTNGLVGYWPFCGNANDVSGNGNNGLIGTVLKTTDRFGAVDEAYLFNGAQSDTIGINCTLPYGDFTLSFWMNSDNLNDKDIIDFRNLSNGNPLIQLTFFGGGLQGRIRDDVNINPYVSVTTNYAQFIQNWNLVTFALQSNHVKLYINGVLQGSTIYTQSTWTLNHLLVGSNAYLPQWMFVGKLDDIGLWNRALTPLEIQQLYNSAPCTKPEPVTLGTDRSTKLCPNEAVTIEIVTPSTAGLSYEWTRNGTTMPGATASSITVADAAKYKVFVRSGPGLNCQRVSGLIETTAAIPPTITATTPNGNAYCPGDSVLMTASGITPGYSYQWKRFGVPIAGANSANFYAKQTGNYRCEVTNAGGCINQSNLVSIVNGTSCRIMQGQPSDVNVYPNPAKNSFTLSFNDIGNEIPVSIELRNLQGQSIENRKLNGLADVQFNVGKLSPGMYMVRVMLESGDVVEKNVMVE